MIEGLGIRNNNIIPEFHEQPPFNIDEWAAGYFEVAGWWGIKISRANVNGKKIVHAVPTIKITNNDPVEIERLEELLKATKDHIDKRYPASHALVLSNRKAIDLAHRIKPYAPLRREIIQYFEWWEESRGKERLEVAEAYQDNHKSKIQQKVTAEQYSRLVCKPSFLAGVLDARGNIIQVEDYRWALHDFIYTNLAVSSTNLPLLTALHKKFYGAKPVINRKGTASYVWHVGQTDYNSLMAHVHSYLQLKGVDAFPSHGK